MLAETVAWADDREQCATAAEQAQSLRDEGKYRRAREQMLVCARDVCPGPIKTGITAGISDEPEARDAALAAELVERRRRPQVADGAGTGGDRELGCSGVGHGAPG